MTKYKYYDVEIDDDAVLGFAIVDQPAHESKAECFNEQIEKFAANEEKQVMTGALLVADKWIGRVNKFTKEPYYVRFTAEKIEKLAYQLGKNELSRKVNFDHTDNKADAYMYESIIIRNEAMAEAFEGIGLEKLPNGSLVVSVKFEDKEQFQVAKDKGGFSIEVLMDIVLANTEKKNFEAEKQETINKELEERKASLLNWFKDQKC